MSSPSHVPETPALSPPDLRGRGLAALGALVALVALAGQYDINLARREGDAVLALWGMTRFFTNLTVAFAFALLLAVALGWRVPARTAAGLVLACVVMALVYYLVLAPMWTPEGMRWWVAQAMHGATPAAVLLWWALAAPKAGLSLRMFPAWAGFPVAYLAMSVLRQRAGERAPYPFLNLSERGAVEVALAVIAITALYLVLAAGLVAVARRLAQSDRLAQSASLVQSDRPGSSSSERP
ncbi:Pr6Pr family membrane protein [Frigidibacter sp. MR17.24]|uniref:Pr6Pr family membrane protein n=1 Tax=Frigidibacter sp. MR17.24 TaxID=3127345 RepID=UPI003012BFEE